MNEQASGARPRRGPWLVVAALAVIVAATLILASRSPETAPNARALPVALDGDALERGQDEDDLDLPMPLAAVRGQIGVPALARGLPAADLPPRGTPAQEAIRQLEPLVEQGRADATHRLAMELVGCQRARMLGHDDRIRERLLRRFRARNGQNPSGDAEFDLIARELERLSAERDRCAGIDDALFASRINLLERAAKAGNTDAMLDYVDWGLQDIGGYDGVLRNFDEVARRRSLAGGFLNAALAAGDCRALGVLAEAYAGGRSRRNWVFAANPYLAAVYGEAAALAPGAAPVSSTALHDLDAQQQATARDHAQRLVQRYCRG
ncbi:hypothetical protein [Dokdonella sp.]|uniref:hypothetical protein n=1 Tax=Dokdonella sp. TaxID=2291710 RepID=UPI0025C333EE|nr:hypothetical protein [Dokdonella sp.]MBX3693518.1 hypothetical protein [Dokdonella sp.]MCW5568267.1 hypothetical protein [Dokdonella sp.]